MTIIACSKCGVAKDESLFDRYTAHKTGRRPDCKACRAPIQKAWMVANRGRRAETSAAWRRRNPDAAKEVYRRFNAKNLDKRRAGSRDWQKRNRARDAARSAEQRAIERRATPEWANRRYIALFYDIAKLEEARTGRLVHVDHIYPLNGADVCGLHVEHNLQLLFAEDNVAKGNRLEWRSPSLS